MKYDFVKIDPKWQKRWEEAGAFRAEDGSDKPKFYALVEFPYPSGAGIHVGHIKAYSGLEVISRKRRMQGYNVLFPIGFDAFGLPTENYAVKTGVHPRQATDKNIARFTDQLKRVGFSFDWSRKIDTTDESFYKWTQWIFLKMYEHGLVFRDKALVNYCPHCKVVLSNEDSQNGKCDICHSDIVQKSKDVWYLRITEYADRLISGLAKVDYLPNIKQQQLNWIGKSEGAFVNFKIKDEDDFIRIYTTRPDTMFGVTFMVVAPEHPLIEKYRAKIRNIKEIDEYKLECSKKTEFERTQLTKEKTGIKIEGLEAVNPVNGKIIPVYTADYVMTGYGTGAIMAVPAHDQRDYDFAKKYGIDIIRVISGGDISEAAYTGDGPMVNSGFLNGIDNKAEASAAAIKFLTEHKCGEKGIQFKMKDWAFNRQRYWGEPIPMVHCPKCGTVPVPYDELPLKLPKVERFEPGKEGESPLARIPEFVNCKCPKCGGDAKRETDTMPQWAGSSWYYLRYIDPHNDKELASREKLDYWLPVDWYNGGMEHVTRHVIYSRFWHKFLYDIGVVPCDEPYSKRTAQGLILGPDGEKMSKSKGNVVDPNEVVDAYGADVLRVYVLFIGDYEKAAPWSETSVRGCRRFLERVAALDELMTGKDCSKLDHNVHKTLKKVSEDIDEMKFNTAIAAMMALVNDFYEFNGINREQLEIFIKMLCPFAPHLCEEIWEKIGGEGLLSLSKWPEYDADKARDDTTEVAVQVNGKLKATVVLPVNCAKEEALETARKHPRISALLENGTVVKEIFVPGRIVNFVVKMG